MKKNNPKPPTQDAPKHHKRIDESQRSLPPRNYPVRNDGLLPKNRDSDK